MDGSRYLNRLLLLSCLSFIAAGCVTTQEIDSTRHSLAMLHDRVVSLERRVDAMGDQQSQKNITAELYSRVDEMQVRFGAMSGRMDELDHKLRTLEQQRPASMERASVGDEQAPHAQGVVVDSAPMVQPVPAPSAPPPVDPQKALFDKAGQLFEQKQYGAAAKEYEGFAAKYPRSQLADDALYAAGEAHLAEKRYNRAIDLFQQILDKYPGGDKVPHALLQQGIAFQGMGDKTAARILYERVIQRFPASRQAKTAETKLKELR